LYIKKIKNIVAITPVWSEPLGMIQKFLNKIEKVRSILSEQEIGFRHFFLDDAAINLPDDYSILVRHKENKRLAQTLLDGYEAVSSLKTKPDIVVRLDCQEHDPFQIPFVIDHFSHSEIKAIFLPVCYWTKGQKRPLMREITIMLANFCESLSPINKGVVLSTYNQKFPLGYQVFRIELVEEMVPQLRNGLELFKQKFGQPSWGLDLLTILLAANKHSEAIDFVFGGWSEPWLENRGPDKIAAQREKAEAMVEIAIELGCKNLT